MSFFPGNDPVAGDAFACDAIENLIIPRTSDIGGFAGLEWLAQVKLHNTHDTTWTRLVETVAEEAQPGDGLIAPGESRMPVDANWAQLDDPPTVISIGHRPSLRQWHRRHIVLQPGKDTAGRLVEATA